MCGSKDRVFHIRKKAGVWSQVWRSSECLMEPRENSGVGAVPAAPRLEREGGRSLTALLLTRRKFALGAAEYIVLEMIR